MGQPGTVARISHINDSRTVAYFEYRNGLTGNCTSDQTLDLSEGDIVLISTDNKSLNKVPNELWNIEPWIGVVKLHTSDRTVVEVGGKMKSVVVPAGLELYVGNTVEGFDSTVERILSEDPIRYVDLPSVDERAIKQFQPNIDKSLEFDDFGGFPEIIRRASGLYTDDQIAKEMNRLGFRTPIKVIRDKLDRTKIVRRSGNKEMTGKLLREYVEKTIYAGVNTEKWTGEKPVLCKFDGLVSIEIWNAANRGKWVITLNPDDPDHPLVNRAPKQEKFVKKNVYNGEFPYRKVVTCPECHSPLLGSASRGRFGKYYPAYHCSHHGHYFRVPKDDFDEKVNAFVARLGINPERYEEILQAVLTVWEQRQTRAQDESAMRAKKREELEAEARVIVDKMRLVSSPTAIKYMEEDLTKIEQRINDLDTRVDEQMTEGGVDMPTILTYVKYFVEQLKDLLIDHCNPIMRARYFGVIFDQVPSYAEIACGTAEISKIPGVNELFKLTNPGIVDLVRFYSHARTYFSTRC